jgi:hypothetical protein
VASGQAREATERTFPVPVSLLWKIHDLLDRAASWQDVDDDAGPLFHAVDDLRFWDVCGCPPDPTRSVSDAESDHNVKLVQALEDFIVAVVRDERSPHVEDALERHGARRRLAEALAETIDG